MRVKRTKREKVTSRLKVGESAVLSDVVVVVVVVGSGLSSWDVFKEWERERERLHTLQSTEKEN